MDGKLPRRISALALIASSFAGQAAILAALAALLTVGEVSPLSAPPQGAALMPYIAPQSQLVPSSYAALTALNTKGAGPAPFDITIRDTTSGGILATVAPPPGFATFSLVNGGAGGGEFLVAAQGWGGRVPDGDAIINVAPVKLYMLRFDAAHHATTLTPLPVPEIPGLQFWSAALSPDGSQVAVAVTPDGAPQIRVYALPGGAGRTWMAVPGQAFAGAQLDPLALSWSADDRTLAVNWLDPAPTSRLVALAPAVSLLDTKAPGGSLLAASRLARPPRGTAFSCRSDAVLTAGGSMLICAGGPDLMPGGLIQQVNESQVIGFGEFSPTTGEVFTVFHPLFSPGCCTQVPEPTLIWASLSGNAFIETEASDKHPADMTVVAGGGSQDIPLSPQVAGAAW